MIGIIIEAESQKEAFPEAIKAAECLPVGAIVDTLPLKGAESLARSYWDKTAAIYEEDLRYIRSVLTSGRDPLDDLGFRAACLRLGVLDGYPIFLYGPVGGLGITTEGALKRLLQGVPGPDGPLYDVSKLWLALAEEQQ